MQRTCSKAASVPSNDPGQLCQGWMRLSHTEFYLCVGHRSEQYIQVAPFDPPLRSSHLLGFAVSVYVSVLNPGSSPGPWEEPGTHRHWLVVSNASTNSRFHGSQGRRGGGGRRVRPLRPAGASWVLAPTLGGALLFHWLRRRGLQRGRGAISPWHRDTEMSPVTVKYKGSAPDGWVPQTEQPCRGRAAVTQTSIFLWPFPTPPLPLFRRRPVEKCFFEKNETSQLNSIAMHGEGIVSLIFIHPFFVFFSRGVPFTPILNRLMALHFSEMFIM